ncbi:ABC transporter substrate-binding protein [Streptomyces sclerotialus]|uniref:ABC transporter substrate-binding protein n=1 Tax=Streptomyces sclerotialus TaxID=1957 RepID=UPI00068B6207
MVVDDQGGLPGRPRPVPGDDLFTPSPPRRRKLLWSVVALTAVGGLAFAGVETYDRFAVQCADGVRERGPAAECIGVTDGAYVYNESLEEVSSKILEENRKVEESGKPWVGIAYLQPMTLGPTDAGRESIRQELEGAYLAQRELNSHQHGGLGTTPQIKLLLANSGQGSEQWRPLVEQIVSLTEVTSHPVVAVAGLGQSLATIRSAVDALRRAEVPVMGTTVTADDLSSAERPGFFRVVPPNKDQASAAVGYLRKQQRKHPELRVRIVKDRNEADIYSTSLRTGFSQSASAAGLNSAPEELPYVSGADAVDNALASIADKVCDSSGRNDVVYFAGRGRELKVFIEASAANGRTCPITVLTGDDAVGGYYDMPSGEQQEESEPFRQHWKSSRMKVLYTALGHPEQPADIFAKSRVNPFPAFQDAYLAEFGAEEELLSGLPLLGHDSVYVLGRAIRSAAGARGEDKVTAGSVRQMLMQINGVDAVHGLTGKVDFDDLGNPKKKPLALVELRPDLEQAYHYMGVVEP